MASEWTISTLADGPLEIIDGDRGTNYPKQADFSSDGHCLFLNAGNVTTDGFNFSDCAFISADKDAALHKGKLRRHDIVLTTRGTVGNVAYFDESVPYDHIRINSGMVILRARSQELRPRYLYLFLRSYLFQAQVESLRTGSAQPQLPIRDINRVEIPIPPLCDQDAIAHILGTLDDKIELNRRINETLEAIARALFQSWFVDFDPVRAKAEGRDPSLPKHLADLFPDSLDDSELGEIPKGWRVEVLGELADITSGKRPPVREDSPTTEMPVPVYGGAGPMAYTATALYDQPLLLTGRVGTLGIVHRVTFPIWPSDNTLIVLPNDSEAYEFIYFSLLRFDLHALNRGSTQPLLTQSDLGKQHLVIPPRDALRRFSDLVGSLLRRKDQVVVESRTLAALRDTLLPKLISGELRVKDEERFIGKTL